MGQNVSKDFKSLIEASATGDIKNLKAAIEAGADVNRTVVLENPKHDRRVRQKDICAGDTALHVAVRNSGSMECVRLLINAGADVNKLNLNYGTPLITAISLNGIAYVKLLIEAGADVNILNPYKETPLYLALRGNNIECMKLLIEAGANVNSQDSADSFLSTESPLSLAVNSVQVECLNILLDAGADVNSAVNSYDLEGWFDTRSSMENKIRCLQLLSGKGAHVNKKGLWGDALESFLSFLGENEYAMKGVKLVMATGADCGSHVQVKANGDSLRNECRQAIRRHVLSINNINLFVRVPQLPLPEILQNYLLYYVTLDEDYVINDVSDDVDFICEKLILSDFESDLED